MNGKYTRAKNKSQKTKRERKMLKLYFNVVIHFTFLKSTEICHIKCLPHVLVQESASLRPTWGQEISKLSSMYTSFRVLTLSSTTVVNTCCPVTHTMLQEQTLSGRNMTAVKKSGRSRRLILYIYMYVYVYRDMYVYI